MGGKVIVWPLLGFSIIKLQYNVNNLTVLLVSSCKSFVESSTSIHEARRLLGTVMDCKRWYSNAIREVEGVGGEER